MSKATVFSIVVPCFNEELAIPRFLEDLSLFRIHFEKKFSDVQLRLIFVNNNSSDSSKILLINHFQNQADVAVIDCFEQGYGAALKFGFAHSRADYYAFLDLDNTYPLATFLDIFEIVKLNPDIDMLMTNRFSSVSQMPVVRNIGNHLFAWLVSLLFREKISDACSGLRIIHARRINEVIQLSCFGLDFSIQLTCHALKNKWRVKYYQMIYNHRDGESKLSIIKDGFLFLKAVLVTKYF